MISVIVPVYNVEKHLEKCIKSILNQTYKDFEIILIDDGSTDKSSQICDEFAIKYNKIKVLHQQNRGQGSARNAGLEIAKGDYIAFIDSDDFIHPDYLRLLFQASTETDADISICNYLLFENDEIVSFENEEIKTITEFNNYNVFLPDIVFNYRQQVMLEVVWNKLYKRKLFNEIRFPEVKIHEDTGIYYKLLFSSKKIVFIENTLYFYYKNQKGTMASGFSEKKFACINFYLEEIDFFKKVSEKDKKYNNIVKQSSLRCAKVFYGFYLNNAEYDFKNSTLANDLKNEIKNVVKKNKAIQMNYDNYELYKFYFGDGFSSKIRFFSFKIKYFLKKVRVKLFGK